MLKVFIVSVAIAFSLQIIHSILTKGWIFTLEFFGGGLLFGFVREFIFFHFCHDYDFPNMPVTLLNVPVFIPVGWVFTFYLAYEYVKKLIEPKTTKDFKDFIIFAAFFSTFICIPIETAALNMHWWRVFFYEGGNVAPAGLMSGWLGTSVIFFYIYFIIKKKMPLEHLLLVLMLVFLTAMAETRYYFLVLAIILLCMLKYNKDLSFIILMYTVILICIKAITSRFMPGVIPNGFVVTALFIFNLIYIGLKLRFREAGHQSSIKQSP